MSLPPLPLIDGCLFIDNSGWVEGMSTCHRYLQYKCLNQRILAGEKPSLNFGSAIHLALEYRYKHYRNRPVDDTYYNEVSKVLTDFFTEHQPPAEDWRTLNWCLELVRKYNYRYEQEEFSLLVDEHGEPMVELSFALPLYTHQHDRHDMAGNDQIPVIYSGRIDLPISLDDAIWVSDHKTTSMMGQMFFDDMRRSSQQKGYVWAFQELTGRSVKGYMINGIRTKEPPQYVLNGTANKRGKSSSPEEWWNESFQRERFQVSAKELEEWKSNTIDLVEEFFWHYARGYMPQKTAWCTRFGRCPYYDVCQLTPEDRGVFLASGQFTDNIWSPLKQPSQVKQ